MKQTLEAGGSVIGPFLALPSPGIVEMCGIAGMDYVIIDMEHSVHSFETVENMVRAANLYDVTPIVRVPEGRPKEILRTLDTGAQVIMVPQVSDAEQARSIAEATRYTPRGKRGIALHARAGDYCAGALREHMDEWNEQIMAMVQIETVEGVENIEAIAAVEGIDIIYVGPVDLSGSYGYPGNHREPVVREAIGRVHQAAQAHNKFFGIFASTIEDAVEATREGAQLITWATDTLLLTRVFRDGMRAWREQIAKKQD